MDSNTWLIDSHAHLTDKKFDRDREDTVKRALDAGVVGIVNVGYDLESSEASVELAGLHPGMFAAVGVHPHDARLCDEECKKRIAALTGRPRVVAVGETGLDYHYDLSPRETQKQIFIWHLRLAKERKLPVIIHDREAHGDTLSILKSESLGDTFGVLHCFSGSRQMAMECLEMGYFISFAGPVTFHNANKLIDVVKTVPLDRILCETDSPYLAPEPVRGRRNEPANVVYVAQRIAEMKGLPVEKLSEITTANVRRLFRIP